MPRSRSQARARAPSISRSLAPSKTGLMTRKPRRWAAQPRCVSRIWPTFMRDGTPMGLRMMSTGVPSGRKGMSSSGTTLEMTPLLPWRPAILSPSLILRFWAMETRTSLLTPAGSSSRFSREKTRMSTTLPFSPCGTRSERVLHLARLLAEDGAQQLLLGGQLGLALGRDLADQDVAGVHLGAQADDAVLVQVAQALLADIRECPG